MAASSALIELLENRLHLSGASSEPFVDWTSYLAGKATGTNCSGEVPVDSEGYAYYAWEGEGGSVVAKLDLNGKAVWSTSIYQGGWAQITEIALDGENNVVVSGSTSAANLPQAANSINGSSDAFVTKLNADGEVIWSRYVGGSQGENGRGLAVDRNGNVLLGGTTSSADFAPGGSSLTPDCYAFLAQLSPTGELSWARRVGGRYAVYVLDVLVDESNNIIICGTKASSGGRDLDAFVAKLDWFGQAVWQTEFGGPYNDGASSLSLDPSGSILVGGRLGSENRGGGALAAKLRPSGEVLWSRKLGAVDNHGEAIAADSQGNVYVIGDTQSADLPRALNSASGGGWDGFVAEYTSSGNLLWSMYIGGPYWDFVRGLALRDDGGAFIFGGGSGLPSATSDGAGVFMARLQLCDHVTGTDGADVVRISAATVTDPTTGEGISGVQVMFNGEMQPAFVPLRALSIDALDGDDVIVVEANVSWPVVIDGGDGNDRIIGSNRNDEIRGGAGDDWIAGMAGSDSIYAGDGNDTVFAGPGTDSILLGNGDDRCRSGSDSDSVWGGLGSDTIVGDNGDDEVAGDDGSDVINGGNGNDTLYGGDGSDRLIGVTGDDILHGGADADRLYGGWDNDRLRGDGGDDLLRAGSGNDTLDGGAGCDSVLGEAGNHLIYSGGDGARDLVGGDSGSDYLRRDPLDAVLDGIEDNVLA